MDFPPLQHIQGSKVDLTRAFQARYAPPSGFLLITLLTAFSLRTRAGYVSHRRRSWGSPFGAFSSQKVSTTFPCGRTHVPFLLSVLPSAETEGPARKAAVSGLLPFQESLATVCVFRATVAGCSLGFIPSRVRQHGPRSGFRPISSRALGNQSR